MNRRSWKMKAMRVRAAVVGFCLMALPAAGAYKPPVQWTVKAAPPTVKVGSRFSVVVHGTIEPGWHVYALQEPDGGPVATEISLSEDDPFRLLRVDQPKPRTVFDRAFQVPTLFFADNVDFTLHLQPTAQARSGRQTLHVQVRYQSCNDRMCLPPHSDSIDVPLLVTR